MLLMIDNYDSFTYNLVQYFSELGEDVSVYRNDKITVSQVAEISPERIVISPGPCDPSKAGVSVDIVRNFAGKIPLLGVCLGHQSIGYAFGADVVRAERLMHGKVSSVCHDGKGLFAGISSPFDATRYHSLILERATLPDCFQISAWTRRGELMGIRHKYFKLYGLQFHPESILTTEGKAILNNFINIAG